MTSPTDPTDTLPPPPPPRGREPFKESEGSADSTKVPVSWITKRSYKSGPHRKRRRPKKFLPPAKHNQGGRRDPEAKNQSAVPATISGRRWATYDQVEAFLAVAAGSSTVGEALAEVGCEWWQIAGRCARHADLLTRLRESMALLREQRAAAVADHAAAVVLGHQRFRTITSADGKKSTIDEANPALARLVIEHDDPEFVVRRRNGDQPAATTNVLVLGVDSVRAILEAPAGSSLRPPRIVECAVDPPDAQLVAPQQSDSTPHTGAAHKRDVHSSSTPQRPADE